MAKDYTILKLLILLYNKEVNQMKKKSFVLLIMTVICLFFLWLLCVGFPRKMGESYSSVKIFNFYSSKEFYDFYAPEYYFNHTKQKQTLSDINHIDIWYQGSVDNYYSMVFKGDSFGQTENLEIVYSVSEYTEDEFQKIIDQYKLIDNDFHIYCDFSEDYACVAYNHDNQEIVEVRITKMQQEEMPLDQMKSIVYEIMKDSIQLNVK